MDNTGIYNPKRQDLTHGKGTITACLRRLRAAKAPILPLTRYIIGRMTAVNAPLEWKQR